MPELAAPAAFGVSFAVVRVLLRRFAHLALDQPNERSLHRHPVPRSGGVAILAGTVVALGLGALPLWLPVLLGLLLAAVSFVDDLQRIPPAGRLFAHLAAAGVLVWFVLAPIALPEAAVLVLALTWITNLYNFMDGSDGLAGGMSVCGFATYAVAAVLGGDAALAALCAALAAASAAFLAHNLHPARIFLGDVGSIPLGYLAGGLGIVGWRNDLWPLWFPLLVFGPFIGDATVTLIRRVLRGERVWRAHREHYYQRMVRMGLGHKGTARIAYAVMIVCALAALSGRTAAPALQAAVFAGASALLAAAAIWVDVRWARFSREAGASA